MVDGLGCGEQDIHRLGALAGSFAAGDQPLLASQRDRSNGVLDRAVVNRISAIFNVACERWPWASSVPDARVASSVYGLNRGSPPRRTAGQTAGVERSCGHADGRPNETAVLQSVRCQPYALRVATQHLDARPRAVAERPGHAMRYLGML